MTLIYMANLYYWHKDSLSGDQMTEKLSLLLVSGTADKLMAGAIIASGAIANDMDVDIFVSFWGLMEFKKGTTSKVKLSYDGKDVSKEMPTEKSAPTGTEMLNHVPNYLACADARHC